MRNWIAGCLIWATSVALPPAACAQDAGAAPQEVEPPKPRSHVVMEYDGVRGAWFSESALRLIMRDKAELIERRKADADTLKLVELHEQRVELCQATVTQADIARVAATSALDAAVRRATLAEQRADEWTRSPLLWAGVGVMATVAVVLVAR